MYDLPHGPQEKRLWTQWRYAFKDMFLNLQKDLALYSTPA